jgi:hypothetical protein
VATYRLFILNAAGHIRSFEAFEAKDDEAADAFAVERLGPPMELWNLDRLVRRYARTDLGTSDADDT